jgi:hypothetical protein
MVSDKEASKARIQSTPPTGHSINCDTMCRMSLSYLTTTGSISVEYYKYHYYGKQSFDEARRGRNGFDEEQESDSKATALPEYWRTARAADGQRRFPKSARPRSLRFHPHVGVAREHGAGDMPGNAHDHLEYRKMAAGMTAKQQLHGAGLGSSSADRAYLAAVRVFIDAYRAATAKGANGPQLIARLPDAKLARRQLKLAGML